MDDSNTQATVKDLNNLWFNYLKDAMNIQDQNFQLSQGVLGLQTSDSSGLFRMADAVPSATSIAYFDSDASDAFVPGELTRSSAYGQLLNALLPEGGTDLRAVLGDLYPGWVDFRTTFYKKNSPTTTKLADVFQMWSDMNLDPVQAGKAKTVFLQAANMPLNKALIALGDASNQQQFLDTANKGYSLYKYSGTIDAAQQAISQGGSVQIKFDSQTASTSYSHETAHGSTSGGLFIFHGGKHANLDALNTRAASNRITITGNIDKFATLQTVAGAWLDPAEIKRALDARDDNRIWDPSSRAGSWDSFFGRDGSLTRSISQLYLVSGFNVTVTSHATYSESDVQTIKQHGSGRIWPFFSGHGSRTTTTTFTRNGDSTLSVNHQLNPGLIAIWGASVSGLTKP